MVTIGMDVLHVRNSYLHVTDDAGDVLRHGRCHNRLRIPWASIARLRAYLNNGCSPDLSPVKTPARCRCHTILG